VGGEGDETGEADNSSTSSTTAPGISIRHSESGTISNEVVTLREGYLQKQGHIRKSWKKRWFVLKSDGQMPYYKNENSASRDEDPLGIVQIGADGLSVAGGEAEAAAAGRAHAFRLHQPGCSAGGGSNSSKEFVLAGVDRADTEGWINAIERRYQLQREIELGLANPRSTSGEPLSLSLSLSLCVCHVNAAMCPLHHCALCFRSPSPCAGRFSIPIAASAVHTVFPSRD